MKRYSIKQCAVILDALTDGLTGKKLDHALQSFLKFLIAHNKISQFERIVDAYQALDDEKNDRARAQVAVARQLSATDEGVIKQHLVAITHKDVLIDQVLDTSLIGGFKITIGDTVHDGSVRGALANLQKQLSL